MILSTTPKESAFHLKQRTVLGDLLMQKRKDFEKNYLAYSDKEKVEFIENNNMFHNTFPVIAHSYEVIRTISLISFYIGSSCVFSSYHSASIGLPLFILSILLITVYKTDNYFLKSKIFSRWISGKKSQKIILTDAVKCLVEKKDN